MVCAQPATAHKSIERLPRVAAREMGLYRIAHDDQVLHADPEREVHLRAVAPAGRSPGPHVSLDARPGGTNNTLHMIASRT